MVATKLTAYSQAKAGCSGTLQICIFIMCVSCGSRHAPCAIRRRLVAIASHQAKFDDLDDDKFFDERTAVGAALEAHGLSRADRALIVEEAEALVRAACDGARREGVVESFAPPMSPPAIS
jgi:hypothetical protein